MRRREVDPSYTVIGMVPNDELDVTVRAKGSPASRDRRVFRPGLAGIPVLPDPGGFVLPMIP